MSESKPTQSEQGGGSAPSIQKKQIVSLSKMVGGRTGSSIPPGSYFVFKGKTLIYVAIKQKDTRGGYMSATVVGNKINILPGAKNMNDVQTEMDELEGSPRILKNKHAIAKPIRFDVETRMKSRRLFTEVETEAIEPLQDDDDEDDDTMRDKDEGSSMAPQPDPKQTEKRTRDEIEIAKEGREKKKPDTKEGEFEEFTRKRPMSPSTEEHENDDGEGREFVGSKKRPINEMEGHRKKQGGMKKIRDSEEDELVNTQEREGTESEEFLPFAPGIDTKAIPTKPTPIFATPLVTDTIRQEALRGEMAQESALVPPPEPPIEPEDPSNPVQAEQEQKQQEQPDVPQPVDLIEKKHEEEEKKSTELAEKEAERVIETSGSEDLAETVTSENIVDVQSKKHQKQLALEAATDLFIAQNATAASTVDVEAMTPEQINAYINGDIDANELPQVESPIEPVLTEKQKTDKLSGGEATEVPVQTDIASADAETSAAVDPAVAKSAKNGMEVDAVQEQEHAPGTEFEDTDGHGNKLMSTDASGLTAPMELDGQSHIAASANASEAVAKDREQRVQKDIVMKDAMEKVQNEIRKQKLRAQVDAKKKQLEDIRASRLAAQQYGKKEKGDAGMSEAADPDATTPSDELIREILDVITELPGLRKTKVDAEGNTVLVDDITHRANLRKESLRLAYASKLEFAKGINVQRMAPPSDAEKAQIAARDLMRKRANEGLEGEFPIFAPSHSISEVATTQTKVSKKIGMMTMTQMKQTRAEMEPWWREFSTVRTNQGVHDMERMPSRIITSSVGDVQLATKVQEDTSQDEKHFYNFMYWMMREKMDNMNGSVYWEDLFTYAGAMGYNDMSEARINWLITGNPHGNTDEVQYEGMDYSLDMDSTAAGLTPRIEQLKIVQPKDIDIVSRTIAGTPIPTSPVPGKNMSPSAEGAGIQRQYKIVDGKIVALTDRTQSLEEIGKSVLGGIPNKVSNIPDPRFSERGGKQVPNVRIVTRRNPDWDPKKPDSREFISSGDAAPGPNDKFQDVETPDVGAGSREIGAAIEKAEADRLTAALPFKLYAPIHPQACDRYLGEKNYARLALEPEKYFKSYTQQPFGATDVQQQFNWSTFVMTVYGPMLYAFVTDMNMQRTDPVFDMNTPAGVTFEFMELNELIGELERYQSKSADRSSRVGDSAVAQEPIEKHLHDFFESRDNEENDKMADANVVMIALPDQGTGDDPSQKPVRPGEDPTVDSKKGWDQPGATAGAHEGGGLYRPSKRAHFGAVGRSGDENTQTLGFGTNNVGVGPRDIDEGVRRRDEPVGPRPSKMLGRSDDVLEKRSTIFRRFNR
jgi:hypothetical protein